MRMHRWTALAFAGLVAATFATPAVAQEVEIKPAAKIKKDKYVITAEEIAERQDIRDAYDAVKLLRPNFLKATRAKGGLTDRFGSEPYRPDAVGRPPARGSSGSTGGGMGTGSGEPAKPDDRPASDGGTGGAYGAGGSSSSGVFAVVYFDDVKQQSLEDLRVVAAATVLEIRYMTGNEASGRYGAGHEGGAILVKTKKLGTP